MFTGLTTKEIASRFNKLDRDVVLTTEQVKRETKLDHSIVVSALNRFFVKGEKRGQWVLPSGEPIHHERFRPVLEEYHAKREAIKEAKRIRKGYVSKNESGLIKLDEKTCVQYLLGTGKYKILKRREEWDEL